MKRLALALIIALALTACGSSSNSDAPKTSNKPTKNAASSAEEYFKKLAANDPDSIKLARSLAVPHSPADAYAAHYLFSALADSENLNTGTMKKSGDSYSICDDDQNCTKYTDVKLSGTKIQSFEVGGTDISGAVAEGPGKKVALGNLGTAEVVASFLGPVSHTLFIDVKFTSPPGKTITTSYVASYRGPDKRQVDNTDQVGSTTLQPDSVSYNMFTFKNSEFGGHILVKVANDDFESSDPAISKTLPTIRK